MDKKLKAVLDNIENQIAKQNKLLRQLQNASLVQSGRLPEWSMYLNIAKSDACTRLFDLFMNSDADALSKRQEIFEILKSLDVNDRVDFFFENVDAHLIDQEMYWAFMGYIFRELKGSHKYFHRIQQSLDRYERKHVDASARMCFSTRLIECNEPSLDLESYYNRLPSVVSVYRGFLVSSSHRVRRGFKKHARGYYQQAEGAGFFYSLKKEVAIYFAAHAAHHYADHREKMITNETPTLSDFQKCFEHFYRGGHPYVAHYRVKKKDIVLVMPERGDSEIVVKPENARLEWYSALTAKEILDSYVLRNKQLFPIPPNFKWNPDKCKDIWRNWCPPDVDL